MEPIYLYLNDFEKRKKEFEHNLESRNSYTVAW